MLKKQIILLLSTIVVCWFSSFAYGNTYRESGFDVKAATSDIIVVGQVNSVLKNGCPEMYKCAQVKILTTLKGDPREKIIVLYKGPIAEMQPICCELGRTYIFFLEVVNGGFSQSVDGPFGIYELNNGGRSKKPAGSPISPTRSSK
jgi:hypothetical protein